MILHVHNELTDALDLVHVANKFVRTKESRVCSFGKFACIYVHCIPFRLTTLHDWQQIILL